MGWTTLKIAPSRRGISADGSQSNAVCRFIEAETEARAAMPTGCSAKTLAAIGQYELKRRHCNLNDFQNSFSVRLGGKCVINSQ